MSKKSRNKTLPILFSPQEMADIKRAFGLTGDKLNAYARQTLLDAARKDIAEHGEAAKTLRAKAPDGEEQEVVI